MEKHKFVKNRKAILLVFTIALLYETSLKAEYGFGDNENANHAHYPIVKYDNEIEGVNKQNRALVCKKASKMTLTASKYVDVTGTVVSLVSRVIPDPNAKMGTMIAGAVLSGLAVVGKKGISPMLKHRADTLEDESLNLSAPLSISEAIDKREFELVLERQELVAKLTQAKKLTLARRFTDRIYMTSQRERLSNSETMYRPLLHKIDEEQESLAALKRKVFSVGHFLMETRKKRPLNEQEMDILQNERQNISERINGLEENIGYLVGKINTQQTPYLFKDLITLKGIELLRLKVLNKSLVDFLETEAEQTIIQANARELGIPMVIREQ